MAELYTTDVGVISFWANLDGSRKGYVCTSLLMNLRLNALPTASVVIGCGQSIRTGHRDHNDNNAEDLLAAVTNRIKSGSSFIDCEIYEEHTGWSHLIFRGCIIAASLVYKTGNVTIRAVRLECMNAACRLYCQPFGAYSNRCGADLVDKILATVNETEDNIPEAAKYGMERIESLDTNMLCMDLQDYIEDKDIATKIAYISDAIAVMTQHTMNVVDAVKEGKIGNILHINDYIRSDYFLNARALAVNNQTDSDYNLHLCASLQGTLRTGSIMDAILSTMLSTDYMMTLVPTWNEKNFMLELKPSMAWSSEASGTLGFDDIAEINSSYNPLAHINDPEVFAVDFTPAVEFDSRDGAKGNPGSSMVGVYSTIPEVQKWAKLRFSNSSIEAPLRAKLTENMVHYKWREYPAPAWMRNSIIRTVEGGEDQQNSYIMARRTWPKESKDNQFDAVIRDYEAGYVIADLIAQAMYSHMHGASATAQITLMPDLRFGLHYDGWALEQHIGELIDIKPRDNGDKQLAMRGMIEGIQFEYNAGQSASCKYSMTLSRVRPYDQNEKAVPCPVYVRAL